MPALKGKGGGAAAALFNGSLVGAATRMGVDGVRLAESDIDVAAVRFPARLAGRKVLIGILDAGIVLVAELVVGRLGVRVAPKPKVFDELLTLFVILQGFEGLHFLVTDDPDNVLIQPLFPGTVALQFTLQILLLLTALPIREPALQWIRLFLGRFAFGHLAVRVLCRCWSWSRTALRPDQHGAAEHARGKRHQHTRTERRDRAPFSPQMQHVAPNPAGRTSGCHDSLVTNTPASKQRVFKVASELAKYCPNSSFLLRRTGRKKESTGNFLPRYIASAAAPCDNEISKRNQRRRWSVSACTAGSGRSPPLSSWRT